MNHNEMLLSVIIDMKGIIEKILNSDFDNTSVYAYSAKSIMNSCLKDIDNSLSIAAEYGDLKLVESIASLNVDLREAFKRAVLSGQLEVVKYLIDKDNMDELNDITVLCTRKWAYLPSYLDDVKTRETRLNKESGLLDAVGCGNLEIVKYLVFVGTRIPDKAMKSAINNGYLAIVKYLISVGSSYHGLGLNKLINLHRLPPTREQALAAIDIFLVNKE